MWLGLILFVLVMVLVVVLIIRLVEPSTGSKLERIEARLELLEKRLDEARRKD